MDIFIVSLAAVFIALDQLTKYWAITLLQPLGSVPVIQNIFHFTFVRNTGAAFGLMNNSPWARWFFMIFTVIVVTVIIVYYLRLPRSKIYNWVRLSLGLICAGAIGNFIDRLRFGYVVDFLHAVFIDFPVFNVADVCVVSGTFCLAFLLIFFIKTEEEAEA